MNAVTPRAASLAAYLAARPGLFPEGGALAPARGVARARLESLGLPQKRDEYWRFTAPAPWLAAPATAPGAAPAAPALDLSPLQPLRLVFCGGALDPAASDLKALAALPGVTLHNLADLPQGALASLYGTFENAAHHRVPRPLAALNTAAARDGLCLSLTAPLPRPLHLVYQPGEGEARLHHLLALGPGAGLTLIEEGDAGPGANLQIEAQLAEGAALHHLRREGQGAGARYSALFADLAAGAVLRSFTLVDTGAGLGPTRREAAVRLSGAGAKAHLAGALYAPGGGQDDDSVFITHAAPGCESRQVFKKVLGPGATGVFQGKILVEPAAQKTDGYQLSQALLLEDGAEFLAKPELEIYADDVKCSHGSTTGALDPNHLFYLRARGVPKAEAERLLIAAFLAETLEEIEDPAAQSAFRAALQALLGAPL